MHRREANSNVSNMSLIAESLLAFLGFVLRFVISLLLCGLLLPICLILFTPYLLVAAFFSEESYPEAIKSGYYNVYLFWRDFLVCAWPL